MESSPSRFGSQRAYLFSVSRTPTIFYITYDGLTEPLGYSQVLRYMHKLSRRGYSITILSYEKMDEARWANEKNRVAAELKAQGIEWYPLKYHKRPSVPATLFDIFCGYLLILKVSLSRKISIVHARSYVAAMIALLPKFLFGSKFIFDMRGFWADEKAETGTALWNKNRILYKTTKKLEKVFLTHSDTVVSLTHAAKKPIVEWVPAIGEPGRFEVIPTCADLDLFRPSQISAEEKEKFVLGYVGAVGLWYDFDAAIRFFLTTKKRIHPQPAHFMVLNHGEHALILERLKAFNVCEEEFSLRSVPSDEIPRFLLQMTAVCFFIRPIFSKTASAPTKLGELLGCAIPCVSNSGVGDMKAILEERNVGICLDNFSTPEMERGLDRLLGLLESNDLKQRCRETAERFFSLERGVEAYDRLYKNLLKASGLELASSSRVN